MRLSRIKDRIVVAGALGLASVAACAAAMPKDSEPAPRIGESTAPAPNEELGEKPPEGEQADAGAQADGGPRCPHGALEDPHRGFVRCLEPGEADAGWLPPASQQPGDGGAAPAPTAGPPPVVEVGTPSFENGDVPHIDKVLKTASSDIAKCIAESGGLSGGSGNLKVQFLVRARGRAEGVEILSAKGVTTAAQSCVRLLLKNKAVGAPSAEPVGVTVTFSLKAAPAKGSK